MPSSRRFIKVKEGRRGSGRSESSSQSGRSKVSAMSKRGREAARRDKGVDWVGWRNENGEES